MITLLEELQPYFSAAAALLGLTTLGFVLRLAALAQNAERARAAVIEERLTLSDERRAFGEYQAKVKEEELTAKNEELREELERTLTGHGLTSESLARGASLGDVADVVKETVQELLSKMERAEDSIGGIANAGWHLELAKGYMATQEWLQAAEQYDQYVIFHPEDYEAQHSRGVAHANTNSGRTSALMALRVYNEAIAFMPDTLAANERARVFGHRGGMLKRLQRLLEAESDLAIAIDLTTEKGYEYFDARYNLACIYSMRGDRKKMLDAIEQLEGRRRELSLIRAHLNDYFANFQNDPIFLAKLEN